MPPDPTLVETKIRHLEMLQSVINRMADNSARLKTWCISIAAAIIAFSATVEKPEVLLYTAPLILVFAGLDVQYLRLERAFRDRYDSVRRADMAEMSDFSISPSWSARSGVLSVGLSWSVWLYYLPILLLFLGLARAM